MANDRREGVRKRHQVADLRAFRGPHDEVDVGVRAGLAPGNGPEDRKIAEAPMGGHVLEHWHCRLKGIAGAHLGYAFRGAQELTYGRLRNPKVERDRPLAHADRHHRTH